MPRQMSRLGGREALQRSLSLAMHESQAQPMQQMAGCLAADADARQLALRHACATSQGLVYQLIPLLRVSGAAQQWWCQLASLALRW